MRDLDRLSLEAIEQAMKDLLETLGTIENQEHKAELMDAIVYANKILRLML